MELTPPGERELVQMTAALTRYSAIACGGWSPQQKREWQAAVLAELSDLPYLLVMPALDEARRKVEFPGKLVVWVVGQIETRLNKLRLEAGTYRRLLEIANGN